MTDFRFLLRPEGCRVFFPVFHNEAHMPFFLLQVFIFLIFREDTDPQEPHRQLFSARTYISSFFNLKKSRQFYFNAPSPFYPTLFSALHFFTFSCRILYDMDIAPRAGRYRTKKVFSQRSYLHLHRRFLSGHPV